jgi:U3 small nucleolar RNA-associated protein 13
LLALLRDAADRSTAAGATTTAAEEDGGGDRGFSGSAAVDDVIAGLADEQLLQLLAHVRAWNAGARNAVVAQRVLRAVVARHGVERLAGLKAAGSSADGGAARHVRIGELVDGLRAHSERHFERVVALWDESFLVDYLLREMDEVA